MTFDWLVAIRPRLHSMTGNDPQSVGFADLIL